MKSKSSKDTDYALVDKIKEGDTTAFRQIVEKYKDMSLSLVFSIVKDRELSEDILQDAFIKVFEKIHTFRYQSNFSTWLYRIVVNLSYNAIKKIKHTIDISDITLLPEVLIKRVDMLKEENRKEYINLALLKMKSDEALVLRLFYMSEMSILEIIKITGFSKSKVKVNLHRGRSNLDFQLRLLLGDELKDLL